MLYKRSPTTYRKYIHSDTEAEEITENTDPAIFNGFTEKNAYEHIDSAQTLNNSDTQRSFRLFNKSIYLDEIIILGIIFLLLEEGLEDPLLLIALVYLLFFGK